MSRFHRDRIQIGRGSQKYSILIQDILLQTEQMELIPAHLGDTISRINGGEASIKDYAQLASHYLEHSRWGRARECLQILTRDAPDHPLVKELYQRLHSIQADWSHGLFPRCEDGPEVLIIGSFLGMNGNTGDEAARIALSEEIKRNRSKTRINYLTRVKPQYIQDDLLSLSECGATVWKDFGQTVKMAIVVGGGIVEPRSGTQILLKELEQTKIPIVWLGVNADPSEDYSKEEILSIQSSLRRCDRVYARDRRSQDFLQSLTSEKKIAICPDSTILLRPQESYFNFGFQFTIGLNLREIWKDDEFLKRISSFVDLIVEKAQARVVFFPFSFVSFVDRNVGKKIKAMLKNPDSFTLVARFVTPPQVLDVVGKVDLMISQRLHPNVFAFNAGVPFAAISYHDKVASFVEKFGPSGGVLYSGKPNSDPQSYGQKYDQSFPKAEFLLEKVFSLMSSAYKSTAAEARKEIESIVLELTKDYL